MWNGQTDSSNQTFRHLRAYGGEGPCYRSS